MSRRRNYRRSPESVGGHTEISNIVLMDTRRSVEARWIYLLLKQHSRPGRSNAWPSQERLAQLSGWQTPAGNWDRSRVQRALDEAEEAEWIGRERPRKGRKTNTYYLNTLPEKLPWADLMAGVDGRTPAHDEVPLVEAPEAVEESGNGQPEVPREVREGTAERQAELASNQCASDTRRSNADFSPASGQDLRITAQHDHPDGNRLSTNFSLPSCAQRSNSSLRGVGSSSWGSEAVDLAVDVPEVEAVRDCESNGARFEENCASQIDEPSQHQPHSDQPALELGPKAWEKLLDLAKQKRTSLYALLAEAKPRIDGQVLYIEFEPQYQFHKEQLSRQENLAVLRTLARSLFGLDVRVRFRAGPEPPRTAEVVEAGQLQDKARLVCDMLGGEVIASVA